MLPIHLTVEELDAFNYEDVVADDTVGGKALTAAEYDPTTSTSETGRQARRAMITVETAAARYTLDGTAPTTALGHLLAIGQIVFIDGINNIRRFRAIRTTGSSADLRVTYFR